MAKTINNWCPQGIVHSVQMDCSFRRNDGKNDNRSNRNGTTLLALDWVGVGVDNPSMHCEVVSFDVDVCSVQVGVREDAVVVV